MSIRIDDPQQIGTQGPNIVLTVKGLAVKNAPLDIWFDDLTGSKRTTRASSVDGSYSVNLVIPRPSNGSHVISVQDTSPNGKTLTKDFQYPLPVTNGGAVQS